jgi:1,2-dihydroxy-3-keto-5-methylthiopentene dioxygenase
MKSKWIFCLLLNICFASELKVYEDQNGSLLQQTKDPRVITATLNEIGVRYEQWEASHPITSTSTDEEIKSAYQQDINRLQVENGFQFVDILNMFPDNPNKKEIRSKFLNEHTHDEAEIRFFVKGSGCFFLHIDEKVYSILCEKGDLISIPPFYRHWFDMGTEPCFSAIRFFTRKEGWIAHFTGDPISRKFISAK